MNITNINPYQGLQNAIRPDAGNGSSADNKEVSAGSQGPSNPTVFVDPPLFPIAKYQNPNLMKKSTPTEIEVHDQKLQNTSSADKVKAGAMDTARIAMPEKSQPGAILSVKI